ncbi:hypothetical protein [Alteromonas sp. a30]|uniref:hypothetical protein n=1 Tax=Alteromonas sp. a30 TaxID=2730917 RepID=UPI002283025B|nr:hypothetical protein [Alteromonas sp. a30]MCY7296501.1 hypothetical protein [Alteromonas sp. a30]
MLSKRLGWGLIVVSMLMLLGCGATKNTLSKDKDILASNHDGYLLMSVDTQTDLSSIRVFGRTTFTLSKDDLRKGSNYILLALPAGDYRFTKITIGRSYYMLRDEIWDFSIKPQVISYVGDLSFVSAFGGANISLVNQSSMALEFLEDSFPNILAQRAVEYQGPGEDSFFDYAASVEQGVVAPPASATPVTPMPEKQGAVQTARGEAQ